ncbi:unnamed protein product [Urochloa humidicola]
MAAGLLPRPHHPVLLVVLLQLLSPSLLPCCLSVTHMAPTAAAGDEAASALLDLLQRVQTEALKALGPDGFDPKLYVDLPLATDERAAAAALPPSAPSRAEMEAYLARYFGKAGSDLEPADPPDFEPEPRGFLPRVGSPEARAWALEVHALWKDLARRVAPAVGERPERHTLLPLPGRVVVPGSRFREVYYWDSYWVVRSPSPSPTSIWFDDRRPRPAFAPLVLRSSLSRCRLLPSNSTKLVFLRHIIRAYSSTSRSTILLRDLFFFRGADTYIIAN